jgi:DNA (cytosine-5)-methyltransferase 1
MRFTTKTPLRVGTDCSGIEAPVMALRMMGVPFVHEFSSEMDSHCVASIKANYNPKIIFGDMTKRVLKHIPDIDLYICGFPCQTFSSAGKREGVRDVRGMLFWECFRVIRYKLPTFFILENVKGLLSIDHGEVFGRMMKQLNELTMYHIEHRVMNTKDYGIPQSRERVFIVGVLKNKPTKGFETFEWPSPEKTTSSTLFSEYIDHDHIQPEPVVSTKVQHLLSVIPFNSCFIDLCFLQSTTFPNSHEICPCLNCGGGLWCVPYHRHATVQEYLKLQGFPTHFVQVVSDSRLKKQIGNSMSINVVTLLLKMLLKSVR